VADCHILSFVVGKCFSHFTRPAIFDSQLLDQNRNFCLYPTCILPPLGGVPVGISPPRLVWKNYNGVATRWLKNFEDTFIRFDMIHERDKQTAGQTDTA